MRTLLLSFVLAALAAVPVAGEDLRVRPDRRGGYVIFDPKSGARTRITPNPLGGYRIRHSDRGFIGRILPGRPGGYRISIGRERYVADPDNFGGYRIRGMSNRHTARVRPDLRGGYTVRSRYQEMLGPIVGRQAAYTPPAPPAAPGRCALDRVRTQKRK